MICLDNDILTDSNLNCNPEGILASDNVLANYCMGQFLDKILFRKPYLDYIKEVDKNQLLIFSYPREKEAENTDFCHNPSKVKKLLTKYFGKELININNLDSKELYITMRRKYFEAKSILSEKRRKLVLIT